LNTSPSGRFLGGVDVAYRGTFHGRKGCQGDEKSPAVAARDGANLQTEAVMGRGMLLWLIGIPLPIILLIWAFGGLS
jgi:hypothetical protein